MTDHNARQAGLTDERIREIHRSVPNHHIDFARAIEREVLAAHSADARIPYLPYLSDRADGVKGHYAIARWVPERGVREVWNLHRHHWGAFSDDVLTMEQATELLRKLVIPTADARNGEGVALPEMPHTDDRRHEDPNDEDGYLESDYAWFSRNLSAVRWFIDNHAAVRALLAAPAAPAPKDAEILQVIDERDAYHEIADDLAAQIAAITDVEIGEHSSVNDPWRNAMLAADDFIAKQLRKLLAGPSAPAPAAQADEALREEIGVHVLRALKSQAVLQRAIQSINNGDVESAKTEIRRAIHANIEKAPTGQTDCLRSNVYKVAIDLQKLASDLPDRWLRNEFLGVAEQLVNLCQIPDIAQQSATPAECTCPSGNGSLRHPCPVHAGDAAGEADKRDAERLNWLIENVNCDEIDNLPALPWGLSLDDHFKAFRDAIDEALRRERQQGAQSNG